jgi:hypothetical protein
MNDREHDFLSQAFFLNPTIENYVTLRRHHPQQDIEFSNGEAFEWAAKHSDEFEKFDIPMEVVFAAFDAECTAISELSLLLMERLIERDRATKAGRKNGKTHLVSRGEVISGAFIEEIIRHILAGLSYQNYLFVNRDLMMLITFQITDGVARLKKQRSRKLNLVQILDVACQMRAKGIDLSYRILGRELGVAQTTVMRSLPEGLFEAIKTGRISVDRRPMTAAEQEEWKRAVRTATIMAQDRKKLSFFTLRDELALEADGDFALPDPELIGLISDGVVRLGP